MNAFWLCFVPLFVAVDALGILPMFMGLTEGLDPAKRRRVIVQSIVTAALVALAFLAVGKGVLWFLGISVPDFMIAGGLLLFIISISDLLSTAPSRRLTDPDSLGAVPLGVPLITGPAVLTTSLLLLNEYGPRLTALALVINILIVGLVFHFSHDLYRFLGRAGAKTLSKLASLLLAAIGVMMVRKGIFAVLGK